MTAAEMLLAALDHAWNHPFESVEGVLADLPPGYADEPHPAYAALSREEGWPPPGTIRWQVAHLAHCKRFYAALTRHVAKGGPEPETLRRPQPDLAAELKALREAHADQRAALAELTDADLDREESPGRTLADFLLGTIRHDSWHGGQIAVLRRLAGAPPA